MKSTCQNVHMADPKAMKRFPSRHEYLGMLDNMYWKHLVHASSKERAKREPMVGVGECGHRAAQGLGAGSEQAALTQRRGPREVVCWKCPEPALSATVDTQQCSEMCPQPAHGRDTASPLHRRGHGANGSPQNARRSLPRRPLSVTSSPSLTC